MSVTATERSQTGVNAPAGHGCKIFDVVATLDADVLVTITHGMNYPPLDVTLTPLRDEYHTSRWFVSAITATTVSLTKSTAAGSGTGVSAAQVRATLRWSGA